MHTFVPKNDAARNCHRCGLPLTDAASCNEGIGPICRKLDNFLLARIIPSDIPTALVHYAEVNTLDLAGATVAVFIELETLLLAPDAFTRQDWRKAVKMVEWMLSFPQTTPNQKRLYSLVMALGYVGIVRLWKGEASTGTARVWFQGGTFYVCGPQNKAARLAFCKIGHFHKAKNYLGVVTGPEQAGGKPYWTIPLYNYSKVYDLVVAYYPNHTGLAEALSAAAAWKEKEDSAAKGVQDKAEAPLTSLQKVGPTLGYLDVTGPVVSLQEVGPTLAYPHGHLEIQVPYKQEFVAMFKQKIAATNRYYLYNSSAWIVDAMYLDTIKELLNEYYPEAYQESKEKVHPQVPVTYHQHTQAD